ncbi:MAG: hypothetical protein KIH63_004500 [Candidatus Saccharibacteria bacterium]|nr:hypothetical protein [Candidatus Saccharibacteria bacterium]
MDNQTPPTDPNPAPAGATPAAGQSFQPQQPYNGLPTPQPNAPLQPVMPPKSKGRRKLLLLVVLPLLLLGGGSAAAYYSYYVPRQTNKRVLEAFFNLANANNFSSVTTTAEVMQNGSTSPAFAIDVTAGSDGEGNARADMDVTYSALRLSGSIIARNDNTAYVKINELSSLLDLAGSYTGADVSSLAATVGDKWIQVDASSLSQTGLVDDSQTAEANTCVAAIQEIFGSGRQAFMDQLVKVYDQNSFLTAKKVGREDVNGQSSTKYLLTIDKTKMANFLSSDQFDLPALETACNIASESTTDQDRQEMQDELNKLSISDTYLWLNKSNQVSKIATKLGSEGTDVQLGMTFGTDKLDAAVPSDVLPAETLLQEFQGALLNSYLGGQDALVPEDYQQYLVD